MQIMTIAVTLLKMKRNLPKYPQPIANYKANVLIISIFAAVNHIL
jgi:hypothetical protein